MIYNRRLLQRKEERRGRSVLLCRFSSVRTVALSFIVVLFVLAATTTCIQANTATYVDVNDRRDGGQASEVDTTTIGTTSLLRRPNTKSSSIINSQKEIENHQYYLQDGEEEEDLTTREEQEEDIHGISSDNELDEVDVKTISTTIHDKILNHFDSYFTIRRHKKEFDVDAVQNVTNHVHTSTSRRQQRRQRRVVEDNAIEKEESPPLWEAIFVTIVLLGMFIALLTDRIGADWVMITALTLCMVSGIITIPEGLEGFSNEGVMTVVVLFVVAAGIAHTGALDWYMGKLLGKPRNISDAQVRLMIPMAFVSAFLNNTPVVVIMIPIVQRWGKSNGISSKQLLIPLSFSSILGGTCTLIGTSTNLVVFGLLQQDYPNVASQISIFSLGEYGIPIAFVGAVYMLLFSQWFIPGGKLCNSNGSGNDNGGIVDSDTDVLLGARLTKWSSSAGRTVKRSGLRDTGGIYLVSVYRVTTGNVHRAVGQDFVLNAGDVLYFTSNTIEEFGTFCNEHSLEIITNEVEHELVIAQQQQQAAVAGVNGTTTIINTNTSDSNKEMSPIPPIQSLSLKPIHEMESFDGSTEAAGATAAPPFLNLGTNPSTLSKFAALGTSTSSLRRTKSGGATSTALKLRLINRMTDLIHGRTDCGDLTTATTMDICVGDDLGHHSEENVVKQGGDPPQIIVVKEETTGSSRNLTDELVLIAVNCVDRPGLLYDISRSITTSLNLQCRHSEAAVIGIRSMSIWRCETASTKQKQSLDEDNISSVLKAMLENETGIQAVKERGISVIRAIVTKHSRLIGQTATELNFRDTYKAAIVAVKRGSSEQKHSSNAAATTQPLSTIKFQAGDLLVLQASDDSYLLQKPPTDFYTNKNNFLKDSTTEHGGEPNSNSMSSPTRKVSSVQDLVSLVTTKVGLPSPMAGGHRKSGDLMFDVEQGGGGENDSKVTPAASVSSILDNIVNGSSSSSSQLPRTAEDIEFEMEYKRQQEREAIWRDLQVLHLSSSDHDGDDGNDDTATGGHVREFLTAMQVSSNSALSKKSAVSSGLTKLSGVYLVSIERPYVKPPAPPQDSDPSNNNNHDGPEVISLSDTASVTSYTGGRSKKPKVTPVSVDEPLMAGDILWFAGSATAISDLRKIPGLVSNERDNIAAIEEKVYDRRLVQAVVAKQSPLVGKTPAEVRFRTKYGAAVIAVHRDGKRLQEHPGRVKLQGGDVLLLEAGPTFIKKNTDNDKSFSLLSEVENSAPPRLRFLIPALLLTVLMIVVATAGVISLLLSALLVSILMVAFGILSQQEARDAINWDVYVTIASAFGLCTAMQNSGVSSALANFLVNLGNSIGAGSAGLFGAVYLATFLISNIVTNNAAAALIYPVAMEAAILTDTDQVLMAYCIMLSASASFMSPFGYTTNLLIYGPGGYKFKDFLLFGTPMQLILWILTTALLSVKIGAGGWWFSWLVTGILFVVVTIVMIAGGSLCSSGGQGGVCFKKKTSPTKDN